MPNEGVHISVCICTFKRPNLLRRSLTGLERQLTEGLFTYSAVVADNDRMQSARQVVAEFAAATSLPVTYCVEPEQNIALARNKALQCAEGDFVAFIDDDEVPAEDWLKRLYEVCSSLQVDGVLGPVNPYFDHEPPQWVVKGKFFERPTHPTGYRLDWSQTRTGNVLFKREILSGTLTPFRPEFGTGSEDVDFFRRMMEKGCVFVWCNEAVVHEAVSPTRCTRGYLLRLALLRGSNSAKHPARRVRNLAKSLIAVPSYVLALPVLLLFGQHIFMRYLIKLLDHASRILAFLGLRLVRER